MVRCVRTGLVLVIAMIGMAAASAIDLPHAQPAVTPPESEGSVVTGSETNVMEAAEFAIQQLSNNGTWPFMLWDIYKGTAWSSARVRHVHVKVRYKLELVLVMPDAPLAKDPLQVQTFTTVVDQQRGLDGTPSSHQLMSSSLHLFEEGPTFVSTTSDDRTNSLAHLADSVITNALSSLPEQSHHVNAVISRQSWDPKATVWYVEGSMTAVDQRSRTFSLFGQFPSVNGGEVTDDGVTGEENNSSEHRDKILQLVVSESQEDIRAEYEEAPALASSET